MAPTLKEIPIVDVKKILFISTGEVYGAEAPAKVTENFIGKLISLGAILNLICFFYFIRKQKDSHAAGILIATILIAVGTFITKL